MNEMKPVLRDLVLVVDDNLEFLRMLEALLKADGITCTTAASVSVAIHCLKTMPIALTLIDWRLKDPRGEKTGAQVLRFCRQTRPAMPIIVMSGSDLEPRTDAILEEADSFLQKPFAITLLVSHLEWWLRRVKLTPT